MNNDKRLDKLSELTKLLNNKIKELENEKTRQEETPNETKTETKKDVSKKPKPQIQVKTKDFEGNEVLFTFGNSEKQYKKVWGIWKKEIKETDSSIKAYLLFTDGSHNCEIHTIKNYSVQYSIESKKKAYYFLDKAIFTHKGKPMFWIYKDLLITVDSIKTENEKYIAVFSPINWFNIIENVVTSKLTMGEAGGLSGFLGKYWKIILVVIIAVGGYLISTGQITTP